jgi:signal peptidase I
MISSLERMENNNYQADKPVHHSHHRERRWYHNEYFSTGVVILLSPIVAFLLTQFVFQSYQVDGPSMEKTLQNGDRLIVTKVGRTWARITQSDYAPNRYDIIIFNHSSDYGDGTIQEKQLVKRVIGLPGDRVLVKDGQVVIYNNEHPDGFLVDNEGPESKTITVTNAPTEGGVIDETVKDGEVYVMGDNRENSMDSRSFGTVREQDIVGHLAMRIYPFEKFTRF